jgi:hypothetical protein
VLNLIGHAAPVIYALNQRSFWAGLVLILRKILEMILSVHYSALLEIWSNLNDSMKEVISSERQDNQEVAGTQA